MNKSLFMSSEVLFRLVVYYNSPDESVLRNRSSLKRSSINNVKKKWNQCTLLIPLQQKVQVKKAYMISLPKRKIIIYHTMSEPSSLQSLELKEFWCPAWVGLFSDPYSSPHLLQSLNHIHSPRIRAAWCPSGKSSTCAWIKLSLLTEKKL